jgi:stress-induced morphogen
MIMVMQANEIQALLLEAFPESIIKIDDLAGDGNHYAATIVAKEFVGLNRVKQHQLVYAALKGKMDGSHGELHALALTTKAME